MAFASPLFNKKKWVDPLVVAGFLVPIVLAIVAGSILHTLTKPIPSPVRQITNASGGVTETTPVNQPTAAEIAAANVAVLGYCQNDLRQDTSCDLIANSSMIAPGFVETGLKMRGNFAADGSSSTGVALAKGTGTSWSVIWVGTGCIPQNVATQYSVPSTLNICSS